MQVEFSMLRTGNASRMKMSFVRQGLRRVGKINRGIWRNSLVPELYIRIADALPTGVLAETRPVNIPERVARSKEVNSSADSDCWRPRSIRSVRQWSEAAARNHLLTGNLSTRLSTSTVWFDLRKQRFLLLSFGKFRERNRDGGARRQIQSARIM